VRSRFAFTVAATALVASASAQAGTPSCVPPGTSFDDEFQGSSVDWSKWSPAYWWAKDGSNMSGGLASWMVNPTYQPTAGATANPYSVSNGTLTIRIFPTPASVNSSAVGNSRFLSGQLTTKDSFSQLYGYFEARMQVPAGVGVSSAFWLLPADGTWTEPGGGGEIDAPEIDADPRSILWGVHGPGNVTPTINTYNAPDASAGMHTYGVDWEADKITFYLDGKQAQQTATPPNIHRAMYLLLDTVANSGGWNGTPPDGYSGVLKVEYVRAWPRMPSAATLATCGPAPTGPTVVASGPSASAPTPSAASSSSSFVPAPVDKIGFDVTGSGTVDFVPVLATGGSVTPATGPGDTIPGSFEGTPPDLGTPRTASAPTAASGAADSGTGLPATLAATPDGDTTVRAPGGPEAEPTRHRHHHQRFRHHRQAEGDRDGDGDRD
jgi:beta-glucanase (GH16 family)